MNYNNKYIDLLVKCPKVILEPPPGEFKEDRGHKKKNFTLVSVDGLYNFKGFIRYNTKFQENFSVGLDYNPKDEKGTICLLRCNGSHGENRERPHHSEFHIHIADANTINSGLKPESNIKPTNEYSSLEQAIQFFVNLINLNQEDKTKYFPEKPLELFDGNEANT